MVVLSIGRGAERNSLGQRKASDSQYFLGIFFYFHSF